MRFSDSLGKLTEALAAFTADVGPIAKNKEGRIPYRDKNSGEWREFTYKYADLSDQREHVREKLKEHGLAVVQSSGSDGKNVIVETLLSHVSGEWVQSDALLIETDGSAQGMGGAITYGRRYQFSAILSIAGEEDDDGRAATQGARDASGGGKTYGSGKTKEIAEPSTVKKDGPRTTEQQNKMIYAIKSKLGMSDDALKAAIARDYTLEDGRVPEHVGDLSKAQASNLIDRMDAAKKEKEAKASTGSQEPASAPGDTSGGTQEPDAGETAGEGYAPPGPDDPEIPF